MQAAINSKMSENSFDPDSVMNELREMKMKVMAMMPRVAFKMSGVDKHLNTALRSIDSALSEAMKSSQQIAAQRPIDFSGAAGAPASGGPPTAAALI